MEKLWNTDGAETSWYCTESGMYYVVIEGGGGTYTIDVAENPTGGGDDDNDADGYTTTDSRLPLSRRLGATNKKNDGTRIAREQWIYADEDVGVQYFEPLLF